MGKVLVLDDEVDVLSLVRKILLKMGYEVHATTRIDEFYSVFDENVKLILLDDVMPEKTGIEICRELKNDAEKSKIPVILFSASGSKDKKEEAIKAGAEEFLLKPFSIEQLVNIIDRHYPPPCEAKET